jgi:CBS domain-containing protein
MRCNEIMKRAVECISPQDTVQSAARRMRDEQVGFLPVCDSEKKVLGTVTDRDLAIRVLAEARAATTTPIADVFTRDVVACRPQDSLSKAEELMAGHRKSRILCLDDDGRLAGVISLSDIAEAESGSRAAKTMRAVSQRKARA